MKNFRLALSAIIAAPILFVASAKAQDSDLASAMSACGPKEARLTVKPDVDHAQPEAGKALLYVIEDDGIAGRFLMGAGITVRVGLDGAWVGAVNHHSRFIWLSLSPGDHHLCADWRQSPLERHDRAVSLVHINAEADKTYYFRVREFGRDEHFLDLDPIDSDQGKLLMALPKK
jgi:hypothetical protein